VKEKEKLFRELLIHPKILRVEGNGLLLAAHLDSDLTCINVIKNALKEGVFTDWFLYAPHALRIAPPLSISMEEIRHICKVLLNVLNY
jgi:acetylornithine/succinyldiaminopimelate/putrescine aminotransferase